MCSRAWTRYIDGKNSDLTAGKFPLKNIPVGEGGTQSTTKVRLNKRLNTTFFLLYVFFSTLAISAKEREKKKVKTTS